MSTSGECIRKTGMSVSLPQGTRKVRKYHLGDLRGQALAASFGVMHVVPGNLKLLQIRKDEGMKIIDCDLVLPHHPDGGIRVLALDFWRDDDGLLEPFHHGFLGG